MRTYFFLEVTDPKAFDQLPGCRFVVEAGRGQDPELWFGDAEMPADYPAKIALLSQLPGTAIWQVAPLAADDRLLKLCQEGAAKAGLAVYPDAKALALAKPAVADTCLYPTRPVLDRDGKPTGSVEKVPGSKLQLACCLVGDSPTDCADPAAAKLAAEAIEEKP